MRKHLSYTPVQPIRKPDCIISSQARKTGDLGFTPSYLEKDEKINMHLLISNAYMKQWFAERDHYIDEINIKTPVVEVENQVLHRRFVQKMYKRHKPQKHLPVITLKRFQKFSKTPQSTGNYAIYRPRERYKVECYPEKSKEGANVPNTNTAAMSKPVIPQDPQKPRNFFNNFSARKEKNVEKVPPSSFCKFRCKIFSPNQTHTCR